MRRRPSAGGSRLALVLAGTLLVLLLGAPAAYGRVLLVADGTAELSCNAVVMRLALPAASSAVAVMPSTGRGYVAAGDTIIEVDIDGRAELRRTVLGGVA